MPQIKTEENAQLQVYMAQARDNAAKELGFKRRYYAPGIVKYLLRSYGVTDRALLADTSLPPLNEDETRRLLSEIKSQGGFTDKEIELYREIKWLFEYYSSYTLPY